MLVASLVWSVSFSPILAPAVTLWSIVENSGSSLYAGGKMDRLLVLFRIKLVSYLPTAWLKVPLYLSGAAASITLRMAMQS